MTFLFSARTQPGFAIFDIDKIQVLTGSEESHYAYLSGLYFQDSARQISKPEEARNRAQNPSVSPKYGILELGGTSVQIATKIQKMSKNKSKIAQFIQYFGGKILFDQGNQIYINSWDQIGTDFGIRKYLQEILPGQLNRIDYCLNSGLEDQKLNKRYQLNFLPGFTASGDFDQCYEVLKGNNSVNTSIFKGTNLGQKNYKMMQNTALQFEHKFYGLGGFYHMPNWFDLADDENFSFVEFKNQARKYCAWSKTDLMEKYGENLTKYHVTLCMTGVPKNENLKIGFVP